MSTLARLHRRREKLSPPPCIAAGFGSPDITAGMDDAMSGFPGMRRRRAAMPGGFPVTDAIVGAAISGCPVTGGKPAPRSIRGPVSADGFIAVIIPTRSHRAQIA